MDTSEHARVAARTEASISSAGLLVAWGNAWLTRQVAFDDALSGVHADGHLVEGLETQPVPLGWALTEMVRSHGPRAVLTLALPVSGDLGLPPAATRLGARALDAGAAVVAPNLILVPHVVDDAGPHEPESGHHEDAGFPPGMAGTAEEPRQRVVWTATRIDPSDAPSPVGHAIRPEGVREADQSLTLALLETLDQLGDLGLEAAARPDLEAPRARRALPRSHAHSAVRLLCRADALAGALTLADAHAGSAVRSSSQGQLLSESLLPLRAAVRRARQAGYGWVPGSA